MDQDEDIYAEAERQLSLLEEKLNVAEGGLFAVKTVLSATQSNLSILNGITKEAKSKKNFRVQGLSSSPVQSKCKARGEGFNPEFGKEEEAELKREIEELLVKEFTPEELVVGVQGSRGGRARVEISIVSKKFERLAFYKRHKLVETEVKRILNYERRIHSLVISKTLSISQYETRKAIGE